MAPNTPHLPHPETLLPLSAAVFAILLALVGEEKHGYAIMKEVGLEAGGMLRMGPGTLYGSLDRMMQSGLVEETGFTDDQRRRYYRVTELGSRVLSAESRRLSRAVASARRKGMLEAAK
jgi:DNA-binding PadR family transcriptional regulator